MPVEGNLSNDFGEILKNSALSEEAREAIRIISEGSIPSGKQVARPDLMNIIKFLLETFNCVEGEMKRTVKSKKLKSRAKNLSPASNVTRNSPARKMAVSMLRP